MKMTSVLVIVGALLLLAACSPGGKGAVVDDFASCVEAGNPVMESYPRQCVHDGETYVEEVGPDLPGPDNPGEVVGGDVDEHGCKASAGYQYDSSLNACIREWELDDEQRAAAMIAVESLGSDGWTVVEVLLSDNCDACYTVGLDRNGQRNTLAIADGEVIGASGGEFMCTREYRPVCGTVVVNCVQAPCPPQQQTFSNRCEAEAAGAFDIVDGECSPEVDLGELCAAVGGEWLPGYRECEGMPADVCEGAGGSFDGCASACRHDEGAVACTLQCVPVCSF